MGILTAYYTDKGIKKAINQDSLLIKQARFEGKEIVFAIICDGMGGLSKGELASATLVKRMAEWFHQELLELLQGSFKEEVLWEQWNEIIVKTNQKMNAYGEKHSCHLGTTITGMLIYDNHYYVMHVGDSRLYELSNALYQLTEDQTVVAKEIKQGRLTKEQARMDPRRNVLLQCIGDSKEVIPDFLSGECKAESVYLLCSDGFRHELTAEEIWGHFAPKVLLDECIMQKNAKKMTEVNMQRFENDNISVILLKNVEERKNG